MSLLSLIGHTICPCLFPRRREVAHHPEETIPLATGTDRVEIRQKSLSHLATSSESVRTTIQDVLSKATYLKRPESLLEPERDFRALAHDEMDPTGKHPLKKITLKQFNEPLKPDARMEGVCQDLAYSVGKALEPKLGKDYTLEVATGFCPQYFQGGTHFFLLATPKTPEAAATGNILIDPSFGKIIENYRHTGADPTKYSISRRWGLDAFYEYRGGPDYCFNLLKPGFDSDLPPTGSCVPLGYVSDIIPELAKPEDTKTAMLYLTFQVSLVDRETVQVYPSIQRHSHAAPEPVPTIRLSDLPDTHPFMRLLAKIKTDLRPPKGLRRTHKVLQFNVPQ